MFCVKLASTFETASLTLTYCLKIRVPTATLLTKIDMSFKISSPLLGIDYDKSLKNSRLLTDSHLLR